MFREGGNSNSPTKNLTEKRKKEFLMRKANMLAMFELPKNDFNLREKEVKNVTSSPTS
jgi:hypothetical protein